MPPRPESENAGLNLSRILPWLPVIVLGVSVIVTATSAQVQIQTNTKALDKLTNAIELRVPTFIYDSWKRAVNVELAELAKDVEANDKALSDAKQGAIRTDSRIELEVERLRHQIEKNEQEQNLKLDSIINKLNTLKGTSQ